MRNPESSNIFDQVEDIDDSPYAEKNEKTTNYKKELKKQREQIETNAFGRSVLTDLNEKPMSAEESLKNIRDTLAPKVGELEQKKEAKRRWRKTTRDELDKYAK